MHPAWRGAGLQACDGTAFTPSLVSPRGCLEREHCAMQQQRRLFRIDALTRAVALDRFRVMMLSCLIVLENRDEP